MLFKMLKEGRISLEEVIKQIDIVKEISSYIELRRSGTNYLGRCPFHNDSTPSLSVSEHKKLWKCFGCGKGGDIVKFVSLYENTSYQEALQKLAIKYNLPINIKINKEEDEHIYKVMSSVLGFYKNELIKSKEALSYLKSRSISPKTIEELEFGYSPNHYALVDFLKANNLLDVYKSTQNISITNTSLRDNFAHRLIIPIKNSSSAVVGFGGRILNKDLSNIKYLNSTDSNIFKKSKLLFGLDLALPYLKESAEAILVEGYFDMVRLYQLGVKNTIAPLGTAFTQDQAKILSKYVKKVYIFFDNDTAGKNATLRVAPYLLEQDIDVFYVKIEEDIKDPDEFGLKYGKEGVLELLSKAKNFLDILLNSKNIELSLKTLSYMQNPQKVYEYTQKLLALNVPKTMIEKYISQKDKKDKFSKDEILDLPINDKILLKALTLCKDINPLDINFLNPHSFILAEKIINNEELTEEEKNLLNSIEYLSEEGALRQLGDMLSKEDQGAHRLLEFSNTILRKAYFKKHVFSSYVKKEDGIF